LTGPEKMAENTTMCGCAADSIRDQEVPACSCIANMVRNQDAKEEREYHEQLARRLCGHSRTLDGESLLTSAGNTLATVSTRKRGPRNALNCAASAGSTQRTLAALSKGLDVNQATFDGGFTPLMQASDRNYLRVVRILLKWGADVSIADDAGLTALTYSSKGGYLAMTRVLIKAGADLNHASDAGDTPLHFACERGHSAVVSALIEEGANIDSRALDGATPLYVGANNGNLGAVRLLLRAKADPLLTKTDGDDISKTYVPLDIAVGGGHTDVVRELIQQVGIKGCGGASGGLDALTFAARGNHMHIVEMLTDSGVVDTGEALANAARYGRRRCMMFLLRHQLEKYTGEGAYVDYKCGSGRTPLFEYIATRPCSCCPNPKLVRLLMDAGADTTSSFRLVDEKTGEEFFDGTPLAFTDKCIREVTDRDEAWREGRLSRLKAVRRLLLRTEAVHSASWLWQNDPRPIANAREDTGTPPPRMALRILRQKNDSHHRRALLSRLCRWVVAGGSPCAFRWSSPLTYSATTVSSSCGVSC